MRTPLLMGLAVLGMLAIATPPKADAQETTIRTKDCVSDRIEGGGEADQVVILKNSCDVDVDWKMCLDRSDWGWDAFDRGTLAPKQVQRLYIYDLPPGAKYNYRYSWCNLDACPIELPDC